MRTRSTPLRAFTPPLLDPSVTVVMSVAIAMSVVAAPARLAASTDGAAANAAVVAAADGVRSIEPPGNAVDPPFDDTSDPPSGDASSPPSEDASSAPSDKVSGPSSNDVSVHVLGNAPFGAPLAVPVRVPSIAAVHVRRHEPSGVELLRARVELSPHGLRVRDGAGHGAFEVIEDFVGERVWFVDRERAIAHELGSDDAAELTGVDDEPAAGPGAHRAAAGEPVTPAGGFLGTEPCIGGASREDGAGRLRGRTVVAWLCLDAHGATVAIELVDRVHRIVVYRRTGDGVVDELHDLRSMRFAAGHFSPPSRFRAVDGRELFHGAPAIGAFREREDGTS